MGNFASEVLSQCAFHFPQTWDGVAVLPLARGTAKSVPPFVSLKDALEAETLEIQEKKQGGPSVNEVEARNLGDLPVLIIEGEEFLGAWQNRVANVTVLLAPKKKINLPVCCVEQGRWHAVASGKESTRFKNSEYVAPKKVRDRLSKSVLNKLAFGEDFAADQRGVWSEVEFFLAKQAVDAPTRAVQEGLKHRERKLADWHSALSCHPDQVGFMLFHKGESQGLEFVAQPDIYRQLHRKILLSYLVDLPDSDRKSRKRSPLPTFQRMDALLKSIGEAEESRHKSLGLGEDYRYQNGNLIGSMLVYEDACVYASFRVTDVQKNEQKNQEVYLYPPDEPFR
ncbi:MAG TPA: hypothetical protein PK379_06985 [Candidatus Hydrogenedentes bacterium]|nr:hypothetical protein [Candidatus Hydrogenedentota bacterium]